MSEQAALRKGSPLLKKAFLPLALLRVVVLANERSA
jgi:hypothetical protein